MGENKGFSERWEVQLRFLQLGTTYCSSFMAFSYFSFPYDIKGDHLVLRIYASSEQSHWSHSHTLPCNLFSSHMHVSSPLILPLHTYVRSNLRASMSSGCGTRLEYLGESYWTQEQLHTDSSGGWDWCWSGMRCEKGCRCEATALLLHLGATPAFTYLRSLNRGH